jgi:Tol biopolymer transport system component
VADTTLTDGSTSIWIKRLGTGPLSRLSFDQGSFDRLEWLPDGTRIGYALSRDSAPVELWSRRADGTGAPRLELRDTAGVFSATWSPDGRWLVARTGGAAGSRDIKALRIGVDSIPRVLLGGPYDERSPALSPDGRWLAYVSDESGRDEVYVRPFPNVDDGKWQVSANGGREPLWAHSGRELFYRRALAAEGALVAVTLAEGPAFETLGERALFPDTYEVDQHSRRYDVSPDDRRFVFIRAVVNDSTPERHLTLVEHWGERLRRERLP